MDKITRWIFAVVTASLLLYACGQFWIVQQNLHEAQTCLVELRKTAERLSKENTELLESIGAPGGT